MSHPDSPSYSEHLAHADPAARYAVELLLEADAAIDWGRLGADLRLLDPTASPVDQEGATVAVAFRQLESTPTDAQPLVFVTPAQAVEATRADWTSALSQTWDFPGAAEAVERTRSVVTVADTRLPELSRLSRVTYVHMVVRALLQQLPVLALHWVPSQRICRPRTYIESLANGADIRDHVVNVRLFKTPEAGPEAWLMDTLGLAAVGIPDLQCHFSGLDPHSIADLLSSYAMYLFGKGDVLTDESMVRGIVSHEEWECRRERALALPDRLVVNLRAGDHAIWSEKADISEAKR